MSKYKVKIRYAQTRQIFDELSKKIKKMETHLLLSEISSKINYIIF